MPRTALPLPVRLLNTAFAALGRIGPRLLPLGPEACWTPRRAPRAWQDFGSPYFREPLARLCDSLEREARLTALGRMIARQDILRLLGNRLRWVDIFRRHPEIAAGRVVAPVFILGMPRTGTTSMHELLALDPQFRVPLSWETAHPFPPPETASYHSDPRIAQVDAELARVDRLLPEFRNMHPMGAALPQECVALFAHDFVSMIFDVQFRVPAYQEWVVAPGHGRGVPQPPPLAAAAAVEETRRHLGAEVAAVPVEHRGHAARVSRRARDPDAPRPGDGGDVGRQPDRHAARPGFERGRPAGNHAALRGPARLRHARARWPRARAGCWAPIA